MSNDDILTPRPGTIGLGVEPGRKTSEYRATMWAVVGGVLVSVASVTAEVVTGGAIALPGGVLWGPVVGAALASSLYSLGRSLRKRGR